jgi:hypothetical protein
MAIEAAIRSSKARKRTPALSQCPQTSSNDALAMNASMGMTSKAASISCRETTAADRVLHRRSRVDVAERWRSMFAYLEQSETGLAVLDGDDVGDLNSEPFCK